MRCVEDPTLVERLAKQGTALTVCPLSNIKLCVFDKMDAHNLGHLLEQGLKVTINSDDPAYFGGYMNTNFLETFAATGMNAGHAYQLARNSFEGSFIDAVARQRYIGQLDDTFASFAA